MSIGDFSEADLVERAIPVGERVVRLLLPRAPERLLDAIDPRAFALDERLPYWAEVWPSAIGLARFLLEGAGGATVAGEDVLELGAGLGLGGIAAGLAGAREITFTDWYDEALAFALENARRSGLARVAARAVDWRRPDLGGRRWLAVVGADLLYEERNLEPLAATLALALAPGGAAYIADPGRITAERFPEIARARGLAVERAATIDVDRSRVQVLRVTR